MHWRLALLAAGVVALAIPLAARADEGPIAQMRWRAIGPALPEGRATCVVGSNQHALLYYAGAADGGVWKSIDGGVSWQNVSDVIHLSSVGAIAINPSDDADVWVGAGETNPRNDVIPESGLYHSTNGGRSWQTVSFPSAPGVSRILLDPTDPKHIVVGVLGDVFAPSTQRGVYVSFDGGATFTNTLYVSEQSGASDMAMDPKNPSVIYAGMWHVLRRPWALTSGGADDGLYRSTDGGRTWKQVSGNGFPASPIGRIGVAIAPSQPSRIYVLVESTSGVLWRSDDSGSTWKMVSSDSQANQRPFYFSHVRVSPTDAGTVYGVSMLLTTSYNGGQKFDLSAFGVHPDLHDMWISSDGNRMALAGDGGIAISTNGGATWSNSRNIAIGQVYRVGLSNTIPYLVCGGLQDNNAYCGPAFNGDSDGITNRDWFKVTEGDGEWAVPDPTNPRLIWADAQNGEVVVYDRVSHASTNVRPYRETAQEDFVLATSRYRFNWESPIAFAAYDPRVAFIGANVLFETTDGGKHWKPISPDLTRNDKSKQQVAKDSVTHDESGAENYGTILDIETPARHKGEIWTGSDDGLVYVTRDASPGSGRVAHWRNVTPPGLPADSAVETVAPSPLADGTVFVSADRHAMGDDAAYIFVTHDYGAHWQRVTNGIPAGQYVRAVRPDATNARIVYAGTNRGVLISCDGGVNWLSFQNNLPAVEVRDIRIQPQFDDLVIATHGRAIWVMDDIRPVQRSACAVPTAPLVIGPRPGIDLTTYRDDEGNYTDFVAQQPGGGVLSNGGAVATLYYWLPVLAKQRPTIDVYDLHGHLWRHVEGKHDIFTGEEAESYWLSRSDGKNEFDYDFTIDGPVRYASAAFFFRGPDEGPALPPGRYIMMFHLEGKTYRFPLVKLADPLSTTTAAEYRAQFDEQRRVYDLLGRIDTMLNTLHSVRETLVADKKAIKAGDTTSPAKLQSAIDSIDALVATLTSSPQSFEDFITKPGQLREDVLGLLGDEPLAQASLMLYGRLERDYATRAKDYDAWVASLPGLNATLKAADEKMVSAPDAPSGHH
jgi:photosystem II stability/assembly factor-like uncharacterized protein